LINLEENKFGSAIVPPPLQSPLRSLPTQKDERSGAMMGLFVRN
jgi:hypothetical protein